MVTSSAGSEPVLASSRMVALDHRPKKLARAVSLHYVTDHSPGFTRTRAGTGWSYAKAGRTVRDKTTLKRIRSLAIPPAWQDVWICSDPDGHLQATGLDAKGRKQYRYHQRWGAVRAQVKYHRLHAFGKHLPALRKQIAHDLRKQAMPKEKVIAGVVALMQRTRIRIGNKAYEQQNNSFGLTTLKDRHVKHDKKGIRLKFKGKSGVVHDIALHSARLARLVQRCKELPGQELFQYVDDQGIVHNVDSGMVNEYVRSASGGEFSSKDLRTWMGSACCVDALLDKDVPETQAACAECINEAMDEVARQLGNTRAVCKAHYVHPGVVRSFNEGGLSELAKGVRQSRGPAGLSRSERVLLKICALEARR